MSGWPGKIWLTAGALLAVIASAALFRRWRSSPLIMGSLAVSAVFIWAALKFGPDAGGLKLAGLPFGTAAAALVVAALGFVAWQLWAVLSSPRLPSWMRIIPVAIALYAIALIGFALARKGGPPSGFLTGTGPVPWWISGPYIGSAVLLPIGLILSLVVFSIAIAKRRAGIVSAAAILLLMVSACVVSGLDLTRNGRPNLAQFIVPASYGGTSYAGGSAAETATEGAPNKVVGQLGPGDETLAPYQGRDLDEIFARVATGVRYEPYQGILRGATGTAISRSGNAADHSMLLAEVLRRAGYKVRYARGVLADNNIDVIIAGMYPPDVVDPKLTPDFLPYDPLTDAGLRDAVRNHMWVEVFQGSTWLPLDPSFPRAKVGESYAVVAEQFETPADALFQTIDATLRETTANGQTRELSRFRVNVADVGFKPITLVVRSIPQNSGGDAAQKKMGSPASAMGGMGGALGGAAEPAKPEPPKKTEKKIVGVAYVRALTIGEAPQKVARTTVLDAQPQTALKREWIEFNLAAPGSPARRVERVLYQSDDNARPADHRTYTISVIPGRVSRTFADQQTRLARTLIDPAAMQKRAGDLAGVGPDDPKALAAAAELEQIAVAEGKVAGQLLTLRFAAESDSISRLIADGSGVAIAWATPRILIAAVEVASGKNGRTDAKVSLDLRVDELKTYPYKGAPTRLSKVFQAARGIQESVIEAGLVAVATGRDSLANTTQVMRAAEEQKVPLVVLSSSTRSRIPELVAGLPSACIQLMEAALTQGREIVVPSRAITVGGVTRFGWWEVDPLSGAVVGVMQDGGHQAMAEYALESEAISINDDVARVAGMMVGTITSLGTLSALLLKYGDVTPQLVADLEAYVKKVMCVSCFDKVEVKIEAAVGGACLKEELKLDMGANAGISFCDNYFKGFKCAASLVVSNLKNENFKQFNVGEVAPTAAAGCEEMDLPKFSMK